jgi:hypothetical protein
MPAVEVEQCRRVAGREILSEMPATVVSVDSCEAEGRPDFV